MDETKRQALVPNAWYYALGREDQRAGKRDYPNTIVADAFASFYEDVLKNTAEGVTVFVDAVWERFVDAQQRKIPNG